MAYFFLAEPKWIGVLPILRTVARPIVQMVCPNEDEAMHSSLPLRLLPEDKLDLLRYLDEFRFWHSLDDERRCTRCDHTITGRQILVFERKGTRGGMRLQCSTVGCVSSVSEWVYANPLLAASFKSDMPGRKFEASSGERRIIREARRRAKDRGKSSSSQRVVSNDGAAARKRSGLKSIRALLARLPILRPVAMGLHAIHPVA